MLSLSVLFYLKKNVKKLLSRTQSAENRRKSITNSGYAYVTQWFWFSNVRTSASNKINLMALIRTLTISTTTFERMKGKFDGFRLTEL